MTGVLIQKGEKTHTHTHRMPYEDRGRAWMDAAASQGMLRLAGGCTGSWEEEEGFCPDSRRKPGPADILASNLQAPKLRE